MNTFVAIVLITSFATISTAAQAGSVRVSVTGIKSAKGEMRCALFRTGAGFPRQPDQAALRTTAPIRSGTAVCIFDNVPSGPAAVSVIHDANNNKKLDFKFGFIPSEGLGWSNNPKVRMSPPAFDAARFFVADAPITMTVVLLHR